MKNFHNARGPKETRIYASYETVKVLRELSVDLPNADVLVNGLFYTKRIDRFHFIVVFLSTDDIYYWFNYSRGLTGVYQNISQLISKLITSF